MHRHLLATCIRGLPVEQCLGLDFSPLKTYTHVAVFDAIVIFRRIGCVLLVADGVHGQLVREIGIDQGVNAWKHSGLAPS